MKRNLVTGCLLSFSSFFVGTTFLAATGSAVAKPVKTGKYAVVDMQNVILNVSEGKQAREKLEKEIKAKEKDLLKQKQELDKMNEEWKSQAPLLSETARMQKQQEFQEKFLNLRNQEMAFQGEIKKKEQSATQKIAVSVTQIVSKMAEESGYEAVFETSSSGLLYLKDPVDLTKDVIAAYEEQSKKAGGKEKTAEKSEPKKEETK